MSAQTVLTWTPARAGGEGRQPRPQHAANAKALGAAMAALARPYTNETELGHRAGEACRAFDALQGQSGWGG